MRISKQEFFMAMALLCAKRGTCARRQVGCILINARSHVLSTGYNGTPSGMAHCIDAPCPGANEKPGEGLAICKAVHAEQNALLQCRDVYSIDSCFTTTAPCPHCLKLLMNTSCKNIYYLEDYPNKEATEETKMNWELSGMNRVLFKLPSIRIKIEILYDDEAPYNWEKF